RRGGGARPRRADGGPGVARGGANRPVRRARAPLRTGPRALGSIAHSPRARGARTSRGAGGRSRALRAPGRDRGLPRAGPDAGGDGLGPHRVALRRAGPGRAVAGRGVEPRCRDRDGVRARRRARGGRRAPRRAGARALPSPTERSRGSPLQAGPLRRGPGGIRARRVPDAKRARARPPSRARRGLRTRRTALTSGYLLASVPTSSNPMRDKDSMKIDRGRIEPLRGLLYGTLLVASICPGRALAQAPKPGEPPSQTAPAPSAAPATVPVVRKAPPPMSVA